MPSHAETVHPPQVAGVFYPAAPDALNALIADVRKHARPDGGVAPKVVIAPHAGLAYSGSVAATAFGAWARRAKPPRRIVIIGPGWPGIRLGVRAHGPEFVAAKDAIVPPDTILRVQNSAWRAKLDG